jgi:hypothetical protein
LNLVNHSLVRAFRRVKQAFNLTRRHTADRARPIPDATVEKYHRALWALDVLGPPAEMDRRAICEMWRNASHVASNASGPDGGAIAADIIGLLNQQCEQVIREVEKDRERPLWQKQKDFLIGSLRRIRRAAALNDVEHLHFYKKQDQVFSVDMQHPDFQIGYDLWHGLVTELKTAITHALYDDKPLHPRCEYVVGQMRKLIWALEAADVSQLDHYDPNSSPLHLSKEQQGRMLWEAVREHAAKVIQTSEGSAN